MSIAASPETKVRLQHLYAQYAAVLVRFARKFVGDAAEDIVQDAFLKTIDRPLTIDNERSVRALLFMIVKNDCLNHLRAASRKESKADVIALILKQRELEEVEMSDEILNNEAAIARVMAQVERLPDKRREIFLAYYKESKKIAAIADEFGLSERTVENQIYRALAALRKFFKRP